MKLASPPGRGRIRAAPSPTPPASLGHGNRHLSTSDEDSNALDDKEDVSFFSIACF